MALVKCLDCGKQVSDSAPACVHCGRPVQAATPAYASEADRIVARATQRLGGGAGHRGGLDLGNPISTGVKIGIGMFIVLPLLVAAVLLSPMIAAFLLGGG